RAFAVWKKGLRLDDQLLTTPPRPSGDSATDEPVPPSPKVTVGLISDFEAPSISSRFGLGWAVSTDEIMGGKSVASLTRGRTGGRAGWCLSVKGTVDPGLPTAWSGVMFTPGDKLWAPADLSAGTELVFSSRGDGQTYQVLLFTKRRGQIPARQTF